jgi:hypothetical protein
MKKGTRQFGFISCVTGRSAAYLNNLCHHTDCGIFRYNTNASEAYPDFEYDGVVR